VDYTTTNHRFAPAVELRHLRYFLAVSEELHFHRAAERLHIAQPPLSQAIQRLESELGVLLLNRTSRVVSLTEAGEVFAEAARDVLARFQVAVAEARRAGGAGTALRIGCVPYLPIQQLIAFLRALEEHGSGLSSQVTHLVAAEQLRRLRGGELDLGILYHAEQYEDLELELEPFAAGERLFAYLPPEHSLTAKRLLRPRDTADEELLMFPRAMDPPLHDRVLAQLESSGYRFRTIREGAGENWRDLLVAVAGGLGVAVLPRSLQSAGEGRETVASRPLAPELVMPDTAVAWRVERAQELQESLTAVREIARKLRQDHAAETVARRRLPKARSKAGAATT
jgi:DNA-binding transcriptional LysR family regulator